MALTEETKVVNCAPLMRLGNHHRKEHKKMNTLTGNIADHYESLK